MTKYLQYLCGYPHVAEQPLDVLAEEEVPEKHLVHGQRLPVIEI